MADEKIDIHKLKEGYERCLKVLETDKTLNPQNKQTILRFLNDCELGKTIKNSQKKKIGNARLWRMALNLKQLNKWFNNTPFEKVTIAQMEKFISDLEKDKIQSYQRKKAYTEESKHTIKMILRKFYKWLLGNNTQYPELVSWIDTSVKPTEINAITREDVEKIVEVANEQRNRTIIMLLFDSGARIEELLNLRIHDVQLQPDGTYNIRIRHSKTKPRTVGVPLCTKYIKVFLDQHPRKDDPNAPLIDIGYGGLNKMLRVNSKKVLRKAVTPHILRHSSATMYARLLPHYEFCYRYGWSMNSAMPNRYIDVAGLIGNKATQMVKIDEISRYKQDNEHLKEEMARLRQQMTNLSEQVLAIKKIEPILNKKFNIKN